MYDRALLITGGAGYIGSHIGYAFHQIGYRIIVLDSFIHEQRFNSSWATIIKADYADPSVLKMIFEQYPIHAVIHCAASIEVSESVKDPLAYYTNNVSKTVALVTQMLQAGVKKLIFSSSCAVYGSPQSLPLTEHHPFAPISPYGQTKAMAETIFADAARAYGLRAICLRYFNAAGALPEQGLGEQHKYETHIIPRLLKAALYKTPFTLFGTTYPTKDGSAVRDFVHVRDIAHAHLLALEHLDKGLPSDCFNLGTAIGYSIKEVIDAVQQICNAEIKLVHAAAREGDPHMLVADATKASVILGWQPRYSDLHFIVHSAYAFLKQEIAFHTEKAVVQYA